jgi:hypothetical protein
VKGAQVQEGAAAAGLDFGGVTPGAAVSASHSTSAEEVTALKAKVSALESELAAAQHMAAAVDRLKVQLAAAHPDAAAAVEAAVQKEQAQQEVQGSGVTGRHTFEQEPLIVTKKPSRDYWQLFAPKHSHKERNPGNHLL